MEKNTNVYLYSIIPALMREGFILGIDDCGEVLGAVDHQILNSNFPLL